MAKLIMRVEGMDGQIELLPDRVIIRRDGILNAFKYGMHAKREIPLGAISEVGFKDAGMMTMGEIDFVRSGRSMEEKTKRASSAVRFPRKKQAEFEALKEKVFELLEKVANKHHP